MDPKRPVDMSVACDLTGLRPCACQGGTMLGPPDTVVELGETEVSEEIFMDYLSSLGESTYRWGWRASKLIKVKRSKGISKLLFPDK